jgi:amino acid transporter
MYIGDFVIFKFIILVFIVFLLLFYADSSNPQLFSLLDPDGYLFFIIMFYLNFSTAPYRRPCLF